MPPALETAHLLGRGLPSGMPPLPLTDELFALGWSRSNAFAFLERRTWDGAGDQVRFRVIDLVQDQVLFEQWWPDWGQREDLAPWWAQREGEAARVFARFGLVPIQTQLGVFPLILDNEFYTPALRVTRDPFDMVWINRLEVVVHSTGRGLKSVSDGTGFWRWATILGFIPSPFENRLALVLLVQPAGWLGERQPLRFMVSGLSLKAGFPKP